MTQTQRGMSGPVGRRTLLLARRLQLALVGPRGTPRARRGRGLGTLQAAPVGAIGGVGRGLGALRVLVAVLILEPW